MCDSRNSSVMESPPSLSIESFSHSWLVNMKPSNSESRDKSCSASFDASDDASFIEMDPKLPPSRRFSRVPKDFSFDFRTSQPPPMLVDAGELISDGFLRPLVGQQLMMSENMEAYDDEASEPAAALPNPRLMYSISHKETRHSSRVRCASLRKCKRLPKQIFQKYFDFLRPLYKKLRGRGSGSRVASITNARAYGEVAGNNNLEFSPAASPRTSIAWSADNWRRSCDSESSIYEAVLHCKRTNGKSGSDSVCLLSFISVSINFLT